MPNSEVHWHEGMFLRQHHFLTEHRQLLRLMQADTKWALHHGWGLRALRLNADALKNFRFSVSALRARLRDGTLIEVPDDGPLPELDLEPALDATRAVTVHLGVPLLRSAHPNVARGRPEDGARYYLVNQNVEDENEGVNPEPLTLRRLNLKLLLSTENLDGYESVPVARVTKSDRVDATPQLDASYIPPVLACDAWEGLAVGILQDAYDRIGRKITKLATRAVAQGFGIEATAPEAVLTFAQLRELNEAYAVLANVAFLEGVHPLTAYQELCRAVGQLSVFGPTRRTPTIPRYDHDDLGGCFSRVKNYLDDLLQIVPEPDYQMRPFVGHGFQLQVSMERSWLEDGFAMFIGVASPLDAAQCANLITQQLDMKVGSSDRVETLYRARDVGLRFAPVPERELPSALPKERGLTYFQIDRGQQLDEWRAVESSLTLATRFNEGRIVGKIDGQESVALRMTSGENMPFRFRLYVVVSRGEAAPPKVT